MNNLTADIMSHTFSLFPFRRVPHHSTHGRENSSWSMPTFRYMDQMTKLTGLEEISNLVVEIQEYYLFTSKCSKRKE